MSGTLGGNCERTDTWTWNFAPDQVANARGLAIYHTGNADLLAGLWPFMQSVWTWIQHLGDTGQGQGTIGQPDSSVPEDQPWNGYSDFGAGGDAVAVRDPRGRVISLPSPFGTRSLGVPPVSSQGPQLPVGAGAGGNAQNANPIGEELQPRG